MCFKSHHSKLFVDSDLIQKLKSRERERQRIQRRSRERDGRRTLNYDAAPFYMPSDAGSSESTESTSVLTAGLGLVAAGSSAAATDPTSSQRRQLGDRLYPKVHALQPVRQPLIIAANPWHSDVNYS